MKRLLGVAVIALVLAGGLAGCGARARIAARAQQNRPAATAPTTATTATKAPASTAPVQAASPDAQIAYVQQTLNGLNATLSSIDSNITQADKAADSDQ